MQGEKIRHLEFVKDELQIKLTDLEEIVKKVFICRALPLCFTDICVRISDCYMSPKMKYQHLVILLPKLLIFVHIVVET